MFVHIIKKSVLTIPTLWAVTTIVFFLIHFIPGDPVDIMLGENALSADREAMRISLDLDKPITIQYFLFIKKMLNGELKSFYSQKSVWSEIMERYPSTLLLTFTSIVFTILISIPIGVLAAIKRYTWVDNFSMFFTLIGISLPSFVLGPVLILFFSIQLNLLPVSGNETIWHFILPSLTLGFAFSAIISRMTRSAMLNVIHEDYVRTARAKGLEEKVVILKHALRNALIPVVTILGLQVGVLLAGTIITETIFAWPGIGTLTFEAIQTRNFPLVQGCILIISFTYVFVNLLTDILYVIINPRITY